MLRRIWCVYICLSICGHADILNLYNFHFESAFHCLVDARAMEVFNLLTNGKTVIGCEYEKAGMSYKEYGPVIMCSGGFGADFG